MTDFLGKRPILAVSPHLDDACMAVGATLAALVEAGQPVVVCTVFAGQPLPPFSSVATAFHTDCALGDDAVSVRRAEDLQALAAIGGKAVHLDFLDAIYRRHGDAWLCPRPGANFDLTLPDEPELRGGIAAELRKVFGTFDPVAVWVCAATGGHVDHRIARDATEIVCREDGRELCFWEGLPYAFGTSSIITPPSHCPVEVRAEHVVRKLSAVEHYGSQLRMLFPDDEDWRQAFVDHADLRRAQYDAPELVWIPQPGRSAVPESTPRAFSGADR